MLASFFFVSSMFFFITTAVLTLLLAEVYIKGGGVMIRQWRIAISRRKACQEALKLAQTCKEEVRLASLSVKKAKVNAEKFEEKTRKRLARMGSYIIAEQSGEHIKGIRVNNYHAKEKKILRSIEVAANNGYHLPKEEQQQLVRMLAQAHEKAIKIDREKQKQAQMKAIMREEAKRQKEVERAIKQAEKEKRIKQAALQEAIRLLGDTHTVELDRLKAELAEAEARAARTISMAQQTRAGHIYIISNIGSFGKDVYKVGMTRRLEPMDRIKELGDASVPFTFDVHVMISSDDAPQLEAQLHQELEPYRVNRVNYRKEFFRVELSRIISIVNKRHGEIEYQADPEALEYLESVAINNDHMPLEQHVAQEAMSEEED